MNSDRKMEWQTIEADIPENIHMHEVSGLRPSGTYKFRIVAVYSNNDNKHGPNSLRFTIQINPEPRPNLPTTGPVIVEARPTSENSIMIRWQVRKPKNNYLKLASATYRNRKVYESPNSFFERTFLLIKCVYNIPYFIFIHMFITYNSIILHAV